VYWEKGHTPPRIGHLPAVVKFLGFDPQPGGTTSSPEVILTFSACDYGVFQPVGETARAWRDR
jgi:hypothetical protein